MVALLPNHVLALGLCFDTLLLRWVLNLGELAHTSHTTVLRKMLPSWQPKLKVQFYGGDVFLLPKFRAPEIFFCLFFP